MKVILDLGSSALLWAMCAAVYVPLDMRCVYFTSG